MRAGLIMKKPLYFQEKICFGHCNVILTMHLLQFLAIYSPMIYKVPCVMFLMRADPLRGQVGGGWALEIECFLGPVKWHRADRRVPVGAQKT